MNKIIAGFISALFLVATPAIANDRHDYRWGVDSNRHSPYYGMNNHRPHHNHHHHRHGGLNSTEKVILGAVLGGVIVDAIHRNRNEQVVVVEQPRVIVEQPRVTCYDVRKRDVYGNVYYERICQ